MRDEKARAGERHIDWWKGGFSGVLVLLMAVTTGMVVTGHLWHVVTLAIEIAVFAAVNAWWEE